MTHRIRAASPTIRINTPVKIAVTVAATAVVVAVLAFAPVPAWMSQTALGGSSRPVAVGNAHGTPGYGGSAENRTPINADRAPSAGPISELDKQLLVKVRQANLWELPAGRLAQTNASSEQVKRAGLHLMDGHSRLDQIVREISAALDVPIPNEATEEQQAWVQQMRNSRGAEFDRFFANQLRNAHGKVYPVIAQVRSTTQNSIIRDFAIEANLAVSDHLEVLEDTGLVERSTFEDVEKAVVK